MSFITYRCKYFPKSFAAGLAMLIVTGCSGSSEATSAFAEFAVEFAREVLAAWLL